MTQFAAGLALIDAGWADLMAEAGPSRFHPLCVGCADRLEAS